MLPLDAWNPLPLSQLRELLDAVSFRGGLAGGYCVDMFVGTITRPHADIDISVLRRDQLILQEHLHDWELFAADPPGHLRPWRAGEYLQEGVHDIWGHRRGARSWEMQIMLQEADDSHWYYRRDNSICGPLDEYTEVYGGWPCLRIEIQLLYKSKQPRDKDESDFSRCLPLLKIQRRRKLHALLQLVYPKGHHWLEQLQCI